MMTDNISSIAAPDDADGVMDKDSYVKWAQKLGLKKKGAGKVFDNMEKESDDALTKEEQTAAWEKAKPIWDKTMKEKLANKKA